MPPDRPVFHSGYYLCLFWARKAIGVFTQQKAQHHMGMHQLHWSLQPSVHPSLYITSPAEDLETPTATVVVRGGLHSEKVFFSFSLLVSVLSMHPSHPVFFVLFSHSNSAYAVFYSINKSPLWFSWRPPACQFKPRHPSTDKFTPLYMSKPSQCSLSGFNH